MDIKGILQKMEAIRDYLNFNSLLKVKGFNVYYGMASLTPITLSKKLLHKKILYVVWVLMITSRKILIGNIILYVILRFKIFMPRPFDYSEMVDEMTIFLILFFCIWLFFHIIYLLYYMFLLWTWGPF